MAKSIKIEKTEILTDNVSEMSFLHHTKTENYGKWP